jgi:hypothetical protein
MAVKLQERDGTHFVVDVLVSASGAQAQVAVGVHDLHSAAGSGGRGNAQPKTTAGIERAPINLIVRVLMAALMVASLTLGPNTWTAAHAKNGQHWRFTM